MLLHDKYQLKKYSDACFHQNIIKQLQCISSDNAIPNIIFYGCSGSGKHSLINLFLKYIYNDSIFSLENYTYEIPGSGTNTMDILIKQSPYHLIIQPYNNNFDKYIIQNIVKSYAKRYSLDINKTNKSFKSVVINNIETLSYYAQMSLRRTMEKYTKTCRFIISCNSISKIIEPLKSRCICIRVPQPTETDITATLLKICYYEKKYIDFKNLCNIINVSKKNIKNAILILDGYFQNINIENDYLNLIEQIVEFILKKSFIDSNEIKNLIYSILETNITGTTIIKDILHNILNNKNIKLSDKQQQKIIKNASKYEYMFNIGRRGIIHLDGFINSIIICLINDVE